MKLLSEVLLLAVTYQAVGAQEVRFQTGHTHDISKVKFSADDRRLISYSAADGWLCYWDVVTGQLLWKSKTTFIRKARENANLDQFGWNKDGTLVYTKSANGTFQTWDATTGRILSVSETNPFQEPFTEPVKKMLVRVDDGNFYLTNSETKQETAIRGLFHAQSAYDISHDGKLFAEGGRWGKAVIRITMTSNPKRSYEMKGGRIKPYAPTELEGSLLEQQRRRLVELDEAKARRDHRAAIETVEFEKQVYITFDHYGEMKDPGEQRLMESDSPDKSKITKPPEEATAIWLRLHNDSPLPIRIPTQSMYLPNRQCHFDFSTRNRLFGLCDNREISIWFGLEDRKGKPIPYGFDFGSSAILLPKTSALFGVPRAALRDGNAIRFEFSFQAETDDGKSDDYGTSKVLRFRDAHLSRMN
jgi:hypothetical protein